MRHVNFTLKPATIDNAKPREEAYALTDGAGVQLEVLPSGSKTWRVKCHLNGKREKVMIGGYHVSRCALDAGPAAWKVARCMFNPP